MAQVIPDEVRAKVDSIYVAEDDRFVVSLIVGYRREELDEYAGFAEMSDEDKAKSAARWALNLTQDEGSVDTQWQVIDRETGIVHTFEQKEFEVDSNSQ